MTVQEFQDAVSEQDLFNYILEWKKPWKEDEKKKVILAETIRNLEMLSWVKLRFSESLPTPSEASAVV